MKHTFAIAVLAVACTASAKPAPRDAYAWSFPLTADTSAGAVRVVLTPEVYAHVADASLRDLAVYDAEGKEVPFGPIPSTLATKVMRTAPRELPWFALPAPAPGSNSLDSVHLTLQRGPDGGLSRLDLDVPASAPATPAAARDFVLDVGAGEDDASLEALELDWQPVSDGISARYRISGSDDLVSWRMLVGEAGIADLRQGDYALLRKRIELPGTGSRYLLLERLDDGIALPITHVSGIPGERSTIVSSAPAREWVEATPLPSNEPGVFDFQAPGPLPIERIGVELAGEGTVANVRIASRSSLEAPWRDRRAFTAFRLGGTIALRNDDQSVDVTRDRWWRIVSDPPLDTRPVLRVAFRPEEFALLSRKAGPYWLVAGSATARRSDFPIAILLAEVRSRLGSHWQPSDARIGALAPIAGPAALVVPPKPVDTRQWLLWTVLVAGAALVLFFVVRLLRGEDGRDY